MSRKRPSPGVDPKDQPGAQTTWNEGGSQFWEPVLQDNLILFPAYASPAPLFCPLDSHTPAGMLVPLGHRFTTRQDLVHSAESALLTT